MSYQSNINSAIGAVAGATIGLKKGLSKDGKNTNKNDLNKQAGNKAKDALKETIESKSTTSPEETTKNIQEMVNTSNAQPLDIDNVSSYDIDDADAIASLFDDDYTYTSEEWNEMLNKARAERDTALKDRGKFLEERNKFLSERNTLVKNFNSLGEATIAKADERLQAVRRLREFIEDVNKYKKNGGIIDLKGDDLKKFKDKYDPDDKISQEMGVKPLIWSNRYDWINSYYRKLNNEHNILDKEYAAYENAYRIMNKEEDDGNE